MTKSRTCSIRACEVPWCVDLKFTYDYTLKEQIKAIPGVSWIKEGKVWRAPLDALDIILHMFRENGYQITDRRDQ